MRVLSCPSRIWFDSHVLAMSAVDRCSLLVSLSLRFMQLFSCSWECFYPRAFFLVACSLTEEREREREIRRECWHLSLSIYDLMFAYWVVTCAQMYAVRGCECKINNEQPKVVGVGTSANKEYWKSKVASDSSCILLERDPYLWRAAFSCDWSRASQTNGYSTSVRTTATELKLNCNKY